MDVLGRNHIKPPSVDKVDGGEGETCTGDVLVGE